MGAEGAGRAVGADEDEAAALRQAEMEAAYRSASGLGFDELIDPRDLRNALLSGLKRGLSRRQAAPEPTARVAIAP
jgi:acetyl-CoA carboxylase carboxyltransferase component